MTSELAKTVSTCAIWFSTAIILTFGLFKMNGDPFFFLVTTGIIAGAAVVGTLAIWNPSSRKSSDEVKMRIENRPH